MKNDKIFEFALYFEIKIFNILTGSAVCLMILVIGIGLLMNKEKRKMNSE